MFINFCNWFVLMFCWPSHRGLVPLSRSSNKDLFIYLFKLSLLKLLSTPSLSNWIKIEPALTPTLLSPWPPETGTHSLPPSSPWLITFRCLRPASTDTFNPYPAHKSPLLHLFTMEGPTKAFRGCTFLVYLLLSSISKKKKKNSRTNI